MPTFTVHEPPNPPSDRIERAEALVFVKDGFSWAAALFAPLWLIVHRLWLPLLAYVIVVGAVALGQELFGFADDWVALTVLALHVLVGVEAGALRSWILEARGWPMLGSVSGRTIAECERRFFDGWLPTQPIITPAAPATPSRGRIGGAWARIGFLFGARA